MKNKNAFLTLGLTGLAITSLIHIILWYSSNVSFGFMSTFYIVWLVFAVMGIATNSKKKINHASR